VRLYFSHPMLFKSPNPAAWDLEAWRTVEMTISKGNGLSVNELLPILEAWSRWRLRMS
jgi:hypothetical protein